MKRFELARSLGELYDVKVLTLQNQLLRISFSIQAFVHLSPLTSHVSSSLDERTRVLYCLSRQVLIIAIPFSLDDVPYGGVDHLLLYFAK